MNLKLFFKIVALLACFKSSFMHSMDTTFGSPTTTTTTPRFATKNLTSFDSSFSYYRADSSYNSKGQKTALLSYNGPEDLLKRLVDPKLSPTDTSSVGKALVDATFSFENCSLTYTQNIGENFYFALESSLSNVDVRHLKIQPINSKCQCLSQSEIKANPTLQSYLKKLDNLIYSNGKNSFFYSVIGPSFLTAGYTKHFQDFNYIDFIDFTFFTGIAVPIINVSPINDSPASISIFSVPIYNYTCLGVPMEASVMVALYDWLNIGTNALVMPFINSANRVALNTTKTNNINFLPDYGYASIHHRPFIYFDGYIQAEQFIPCLSLMAAFSYAQQFKTIYDSLDKVQFPNDVINAFPAHRPWQAAYITLTAELDFATESHKNLPHFQIVYVAPVFGRSVFKTSAASAQMSIEVLWDF
ncbi:MAG: hypothetical protein NTU89_03230 [Candidatus Dependentiae bacterium]|nr:hypothetical protein [Candidatus Dependentiae bacterium]